MALIILSATVTTVSAQYSQAVREQAGKLTAIRIQGNGPEMMNKRTGLKYGGWGISAGFAYNELFGPGGQASLKYRFQRNDIVGWEVSTTGKISSRTGYYADRKGNYNSLGIAVGAAAVWNNISYADPLLGISAVFFSTGVDVGYQHFKNYERADKGMMYEGNPLYIAPKAAIHIRAGKHMEINIGGSYVITNTVAISKAPTHEGAENKAKGWGGSIALRYNF